jgi:uncharacterized protein YdeI (BOF family)
MNEDHRMYKYIASISLIATLGCASVQAANLLPGNEVVLEGQVVRVVSHDAFWLEHEGTRVLVYQNFAPRKALREGQQLRVAGRVSDDWMRLAQFEVDANSIENRGVARSGTLAAAAN